MKRTLILAAAVVLATGLAYTGDYHTGNTLVCSDCHVMHAQTSHTYSGGATATVYPPTGYLLKGPVNDMCLACHDADAAPDVLGNDTGYFLSNRSAGALNKDGLIVDGAYAGYMGHSLGSTATAPGGSFANADGLNCVDCHQQHGYAGFMPVDGAGNPVTSAYRNVVARSNAGSNRSISYAFGTNDLTKDVYEDYQGAYETIEVNLNEPNTTDSGVANWCGGCHGDFHGAVGGAEIGGDTSGTFPDHFIRHPNATVNIGDLGGGHSSLGVFNSKPYRVRVMSASGDWGSLGAAGTFVAGDALTPTCLSCHKAHGNARAFGLIFADGTGDMSAGVGEDGNGTGARDLCQQCHVQGG